MTQKEKDAVFTLRVAQKIEAVKCVLDRETVDTLVALIDGQEAESERNFDMIARQSDVVTEQKETIERLYQQLDSKCDRCIERDKAEAIKEFAERLKLRFHPQNINTLWLIDDLVKEMVGDNNG